MGHFRSAIHTSIISLIVGGAPLALSDVARAEYGALARGHDSACHTAAIKYYVQIRADSQASADTAALAGCEKLGGTDCHIIYRFGKGRCAYINVTPSHTCDATAAAWATTPQQAHAACVRAASEIGAPYACPAPIGGCNR
jgi:hypothetical protein